MKYKIPFSRRGQGLIEILVVMALIGILGGGSVAGYRAFQRSAETAKVKADADSINSAISTPIGYGTKTTVDFWRGLEKNTSNLGVVVSRFMGFANNASETTREMKKMTLFGESVVKMDTTRLTSYTYETEPGSPGIKWDAAQKKVVVATEGERWIQGGTGVLMSSVADTAATGFNNHLAQVKTSLDTSFRSAKRDGWVWDYNAPGVVPPPDTPVLPPEPDIKPVVGIEAVGPTATTWVPEETGSPSVLTYKIQGDWSNGATQEKITVGLDLGVLGIPYDAILYSTEDVNGTTNEASCQPVIIVVITKTQPVAVLRLEPYSPDSFRYSVVDGKARIGIVRSDTQYTVLSGKESSEATISHNVITLELGMVDSRMELGTKVETVETVVNEITGETRTDTKIRYPDLYFDVTFRITATNMDETKADYIGDADPDNYKSGERQIRVNFPDYMEYVSSSLPLVGGVYPGRIGWNIEALPFGQYQTIDFVLRYRRSAIPLEPKYSIKAFTYGYKESDDVEYYIDNGDDGRDDLTRYFTPLLPTIVVFKKKPEESELRLVADQLSGPSRRRDVPRRPARPNPPVVNPNPGPTPDDDDDDDDTGNGNGNGFSATKVFTGNGATGPDAKAAAIANISSDYRQIGAAKATQTLPLGQDLLIRRNADPSQEYIGFVTGIERAVVNNRFPSGGLRQPEDENRGTNEANQARSNFENQRDADNAHTQ